MRVDASSLDVRAYRLPAGRGDADLNTPVFAPDGTLWFTGQVGVYGRLVPPDGRVEVFEAPGGRGPYGISATPDGTGVLCLAGRRPWARSRGGRARCGAPSPQPRSWWWLGRRLTVAKGAFAANHADRDHPGRRSSPEAPHSEVKRPTAHSWHSSRR